MSQPERQCDIVMRGGIASGIVYPTALEALARDYRFRSIGGTSAGAIAAAAAAAAEFGRREGTNPRSFEQLADVPAQLGSRERGRSQLFRLFQPQQETASLHRLLTTILDNSGKPMFPMFVVCIRALLWAHPWVSLVAALPAMIIALVMVAAAPAAHSFDYEAPGRYLVSAGLTAAMAMFIVTLLLLVQRLRALLVVAAALLLAVAVAYWPTSQEEPRYDIIVDNLKFFGVAAFLLVVALACSVLAAAYRIVQRARIVLPQNGFGICAGMPRSKPGEPSSGGRKVHLTDWLHQTFQDLAGKPVDKPLTVGELRQVDRAPADRRETSIELALMTTDVTRGMSHCFPQLEGAGGWRAELYFDPQEMARLFPASVVQWLRDRSPTVLDPQPRADLVDVNGDPDDTVYLRLPDPNDLPVLLGVRMSMSFPLLLSAVPLYTPTPYTGAAEATAGKQRMRCCWFSDGGLTSNFPIHFFDSPIPSRPTFGISLADSETELLAGSEGSSAEHGKAVWMVSSRSRERFQRFNEFDSGDFPLSGFLGALFETSRNWSDTEQMNMPGYRERIVHVVLDESEGGLNLDMSKQVVRTMADKGAEAGRQLAEQFVKGNAWDDHRWIRYRAFMASLEIVTRKFNDRWTNSTASSTALKLNGRPFSTLVRESRYIDDPFPWCEGQFEPAVRVTEEFVSLATRMKRVDGAQLFDSDGGPDEMGRSPRPKPRLRVVPPDDAELPDRR